MSISAFGAFADVTRGLRIRPLLVATILAWAASDALAQAAPEATPLPDVTIKVQPSNAEKYQVPTLSTPPSYQLGTVEVRATRADTKLEDIPLYTTVISQEEIQRSPARTLDQLLRQVPGINLPGAPFFVTDPTGQQVKMRGVTNSKVLVLLDGIPVLDPFYTTMQWFKVPLSSIDRVEILRGGNSSLWGNLAVAGVINIISKTPNDNSTQLDGAASTNVWGQTLALTKNILYSDRLSFRLSGDFQKTDGYQTTPPAYLYTVPGKVNSSALSDNFRVAAYFRPTDDLTGYARIGFHRQNDLIGGYVAGTNNQVSPDFAGGLTRVFADKSQFQGNFWWQHVNFDKYNGAGCYRQGSGVCNTTNPTATIVQYAAQHDSNTYRESGGSLMYSKNFAASLTSAQLGLDYRAISGEDTQQAFSSGTSLASPVGQTVRTAYGQGAQQFAGVFAQFKAYPRESLSVTFSARYDYWSNTDGVSTTVKYTGGVPGANSGGVLLPTHKFSFNPSLSGRYEYNDHFAFRASAYRAFRAPGLNNLYRTFGNNTSITIANPNLQPETLIGVEGGIDFKAPGIAAGLTVYTYDIRDMITSYQVPNVTLAPAPVVGLCGSAAFGSPASSCPGTVNFNTNGQNGRSNGIELVGKWEASPTVTVDGAYMRTATYYTSVTTTDPTGVQLPAVPKDLVTLGGTWRPTSQWRHFASIRYAGSMYLNIQQTVPQSQFTVVDVGTAYQVDKDLEFYSTIVNLFNTHYSDSTAASLAQSTLGMPLTFTIGVRSRF